MGIADTALDKPSISISPPGVKPTPHPLPDASGHFYGLREKFFPHFGSRARQKTRMPGWQGLLLPAFLEMPMLSLKVVTRSGRKIRGHFPSLKMGHMVPWESLLERDAILLFEFSPGVRTFRAQPEEVVYVDEDTTRRYYPDFEITGNRGRVIHVEVKPEAMLARPDVSRKLRSVADHYQRQGRDYRILTDQTIRREPLHRNLTLLGRFLKPAEGLKEVLPDIHAWFGEGYRSLADVCSQFGPSLAYRLVAWGHVQCDLTQPLTPESPICFPKEGHHDQVLF
jgi:hypothetical protein